MHADRTPLRVLVVDDERIIADTLTIILSRDGHEAFAAYSAEQAIELAAQVVTDVLISDVVLGQMNGIDLAIYLRQQLPECCVYLISGAMETSRLVESMAERGYNFPLIAKPVDPKELLNLIASPPENGPQSLTLSVPVEPAAAIHPSLIPPKTAK